MRLRLSHKSYFIKFETVLVGIPFAVAQLYFFGRYGEAVLWALLVAVSFLVGWISAHGMWLVLKEDLERFAKGEPGNAAERSGRERNS